MKKVSKKQFFNKTKKQRRKNLIKKISKEKNLFFDKQKVVGTFTKNKNFGFVIPDGKKVQTDKLP